jgi:DNA-binding XRE family transcriptional regulator
MNHLTGPLFGGREMVLTYETFDEQTFYPRWFSDLGTARGRGVIWVPYATPRRVQIVAPHISLAARRGVQICCYLQQPEDWNPGNNPPTAKTFEAALNLLEQAGAHITLRKDIHEKMLVIDSNIFYDGSFNVLSHYKTTERMTRFVSVDMVRSNVAKYGMNECSRCFPKPPTRVNSQLIETLGQTIARKRAECGLSQKELATRCNMHQANVSEIENGKRDFAVTTFFRLLEALQIELVPVPTHMLPRVQQILGSGSGEP